MLAAVEKTNSQPCKAAASDRSGDERSQSNHTGYPRPRVSKLSAEKDQRTDAANKCNHNQRRWSAQKPGRNHQGRRRRKPREQSQCAHPSLLPNRPEHKKRHNEQQLSLKHCTRGEQTTAQKPALL